MKRFLILFFAVAISSYIYSQAKVLLYKDSEYAERTLKYIVLNNDKAISYQESGKTLLLSDGKSQKSANNRGITLIDRKSNNYREAEFLSKDGDDNKIIFLTKWGKVKKSCNKEKSAIDELSNSSNKSEFEKEKATTSNNEKTCKNKETKVIKNYNCKSKCIKINNEIYKVWTSNDINYNWIFLNEYSKLKGTVIQVEKDNRIVLTLDSVEDLKIENQIFSYKDLFYLLTNWE